MEYSYDEGSDQYLITLLLAVQRHVVARMKRRIVAGSCIVVSIIVAVRGD